MRLDLYMLPNCYLIVTCVTTLVFLQYQWMIIKRMNNNDLLFIYFCVGVWHDFSMWFIKPSFEYNQERYFQP